MAQEIVSLEEQNAAIQQVRVSQLAGELSEEEASRRISAIRRACTPYELYHATRGAAGVRRRQDARERIKALLVVPAGLLVGFVVLLLVAWALVRNGS